MWRMLLAMGGAALTTLALAPFSLWPLIVLSPACLWLALQHLKPRQAALVGWCYGVGLYGAGVSWVFVSIHTFGNTPWLAAAAMTAAFVMALALFFAVQGALFSRFFSHSAHARVHFIGVWMLFEWLRSWVFTGFPWLYLGYALTDSPLRYWAPVGGVWLLSLAVLVLSMTLTCLLQGTTRRAAAGWLLACMVLASAPGLPRDWNRVTGRLSVDVVQANISQSIKWDASALPAILDRYAHLTETQTRAKVVIWPETAVSAYLNYSLPYLAPLLNRLEQQQRILISGYPGLAADPDHPDGYRVHNSLGTLTGEIALYHKQRLVPFGEYVPLERYLRGLIGFFDLPMSGFSLPEHAQQALHFNGMQVAAAICYEIAYPELVRKLAQHSQWILTVSNDTWFSHTLAPAQHLQIAQMRALENNRWVVRSTNNGLTALIDPHGNLRQQAPPYQEAVLSGTIELRQGQTPYQQLGSAPAALLSLLCLVFVRRKASVSRPIDRPN